MKIDPHASLLAAQNLRTSDASARGRQASANFFAELKKSNPSAQHIRQSQAKEASATKQSDAQQSAGPTRIMREAPLRGVDPAQPLAPGSLLNIVV